MPPRKADYTVELVDGGGDPDMSVTVVGDQVVDLSGASDGDVLTVQADGTVAPEVPASVPPNGPAGGVLSGTYPNPGFAVDMATQAELDAKVTQTITNGATTTAPSEDAVFDALALKLAPVLASAYYNPAAATTKTTTSSTPAALDATHLTVSFVAPPSGQVIVRLSAGGNSGLLTTDQPLWCLVTHGTTTRISDFMTTHGGQGSAGYIRQDAAVLVSGLTPGQTYSWDWAHASQNNTSTYNTLYGGTTLGSAMYGPALMEVVAA